MVWPADWDKPCEENSVLAARFSSGIWYGEDAVYFKYRYYAPKSAGRAGNEKYPLVLHLHGADAFGDDNSLQLDLHEIGTVFAKDSWQQRHPCYVLVPQCDQYRHWSRNDISRQVQRFVISFTEKYKDIDTDRIYVYGYSAGGLGTFTLIKNFPEYYAAAVPICGATSGDRIKDLLKIPVWMVHAEDDRIVRSSYGNPGESSKFYMGSAEIYEVLKKYFDKNTDIRYTEYPKGWMKEFFGVNPHCSWVAVSDDKSGKDIREWMFSKSLSNCSRIP